MEHDIINTIHTEYVAHLKKILHPEDKAFDMLPMTLYYSSASPPSRAVRAFLDMTQQPYSLHEVDLGKRENRSEAFLSMNPQGSVPVLMFGETALTESCAILRFVAEAVQSPLYPTDPDE